MDEKLSLLAATVFAGEFTITDMLALELFLHNSKVISRNVCIDDTRKVIIDFNMGSYNLSDYIGKHLTTLTIDDRRKYAADIAREITLINVIQTNPKEYIQQSPTLKNAIKVYRNNKRIKKIKQLMNKSKAKDIDYTFLKDSLFR
ncbi:Crescent membrane/immature virion protein [Sea otter poxvirus]|uniref:Crescent membrane/immature virion protein n=1 Tax=Sea otter poxvirus TaxID=1416741 RepID=A0A2U9QHN7_9POXV|nr:Crescent membrane/immature virion protein [Sea otter poxvirus]AWU47121.1 Crescent membrane/immature virion protein [Sea otter poxvirus]